MFFSAKAILEFFQLFYLNFNLEQYVRKKLHINSNNLVRFCEHRKCSYFKNVPGEALPPGYL